MTGKELRHIRKRLRLTQVAQTEKVGVAANTVARWERDGMGMHKLVARPIHLLAGIAEPPGTKGRR